MAVGRTQTESLLLLELKHLGDHLLRRRIDLGLARKAAAKAIGTNGHSLKHWENASKSRITPMFYAGIVRFLGYNPLPEAKPPRLRSPGTPG